MTRARAALLGACLLTVLGAGCGGGGAASTPAPGTPGTGSGGTQQPAPASYANPAWLAPVNPPSTLWPATRAPATTLADWFSARPWLLDLSSWSSYMRNANQPGRDVLGAFGVGNGRVFALVGLSYPLNTIHGLCGPTYQNSGGYFGDVSVGAELYPRTIAFAEEWMWKPRRAAAVITKSRSSELELYTVDVAPPGTTTIIRVVIVRNASAVSQSGVNVTARIVGGNAADGAQLAQDRGGRKLTIGAAGTSLPVTIVGDKMRVSLGTLLPGEERAVTLYLVASGDEASRQAQILTARSVPVDQLLDATRQHWASFFAAGAELDLPDARVRDWIDDMTVTVAVQIAENGCATPMSRYTKTWMRDQEGAHRLFLRTGRPEPVRRMLDAYYRTAIIEGGIKNSMAVDLDVRTAGTAPDWMAAEFMPGRNPVEGPSYIPIELYDYYEATGDLALLAEQYDFMRAAVLRQEVDATGLMKFNGDEPFRWVMMVALALYEPENRGWSSNSAFLLVAAADRLAKVATLLGKPADAARIQALADRVRAATEQNYWLPAQGFYDTCKLFYAQIPVAKPFEDISLMPLRIGYAPPSDPRLRQNLLSVKSLLENAAGFVQSNALINGLNAFDGMVPGYYLQNLTLVDHGDAERAFNTLARAALCTGEIAEGQFQNPDVGRAVLIKYEASGGDDVVARYRPWEGGLCAESALQYLFGEDWDGPAGKVSLTPHVPNGWGSFAARGLECGGRIYDVEVRDFGGRRLERVTNRSSLPLAVNLGASVVGTGIGQVRLDGQVLPAQPPVSSEFGRHSFRVERTLQPGEWVDLDFDYTR